VTSGATGAGPGVVVFSAGINDTRSPRRATLTIGQQALTVTQDVVACTYTITPLSLPLPATIAVTAAENYTWPPSRDRRALLRASTGRVMAAWYGDAVTIDVNVASGLTQQLAVYVADYDSYGRQQKVDILDQSGAVLDSQVVTSFTGGRYLSWTVRGHVTVRATRLEGPNAVVSGVFLGNTTAAAGTGASATFVGTDTTTGGEWRKVYGGSGYAIAADVTTQVLSPSGGSGAVTVTGPAGCAWTASSDSAWLSVVSGANGSGSGTVGFTIAASTSPSPRAATLTVGKQTFTLTQGASR